MSPCTLPMQVQGLEGLINLCSSFHLPRVCFPLLLALELPKQKQGAARSGHACSAAEWQRLVQCASSNLHTSTVERLVPLPLDFHLSFFWSTTALSSFRTPFCTWACRSRFWPEQLTWVCHPGCGGFLSYTGLWHLPPANRTLQRLHQDPGACAVLGTAKDALAKMHGSASLRSRCQAAPHKSCRAAWPRSRCLAVPRAEQAPQVRRHTRLHASDAAPTPALGPSHVTPASMIKPTGACTRSCLQPLLAAAPRAAQPSKGPAKPAAPASGFYSQQVLAKVGLALVITAEWGVGASGLRIRTNTRGGAECGCEQRGSQRGRGCIVRSSVPTRRAGKVPTCLGGYARMAVDGWLLVPPGAMLRSHCCSCRPLQCSAMWGTRL